MKWMAKLKASLCTPPQNIDYDKEPKNTKCQVNTDSPEKRKKIAYQWLGVAILLAMPIVSHIFAMPFLLYKNPQPCPVNETEYENCTKLVTMKKTLFEDPALFGSYVIQVMDRSYNESDSSEPPVPPFKVFIGDIILGKNLFFSGLTIGSLLVGPFTDYFGRKMSFKILIRTLNIIVYLFSLCTTVWTLSTCWFILGLTIMSLFCMIFVELLEKIDSVVNESEAETNSNPGINFQKFKPRLVVGIGFTFTWVMARILTLMISWFTKDWTLIYMWLGLILTFIYYIFGDFFAENFTEIESSSTPKDESTFVSIVRNHPVFSLNMLILMVNWFISCHNLYGLVIGWVNISINKNMFDNNIISSSFVLISIPMSYAVCIVAKRKLLPYGLLQLFTGISMLVMLAFLQTPLKIGNNKTFGTGGIVTAHIANVFVSSALSILWNITIETFPRKYRIHCLGLCSASARVGTIVGVTLNDKGLFNEVAGPAIAGIFSIVAAFLSRLLPDMTGIRMQDTQSEIERKQFPNSRSNFAEQPASNEV